MGNDRFLKGALLLSASMFISRLLGALYIIPFKGLVGETGMALYLFAYGPYALFISLSTLGIPVGISKFIAKYNAQEEYDTSRKIFYYGLVAMSGLGIIGFLALYHLAPWYANIVLAGETDGVLTIEEVTRVIRTISVALLIIPPMAIIRGFFQGNQDMLPTSVSQLLEQVARIAFILLGTFVIINFLDGSIEDAVNFSVFAAFLSGVVSLVVLGCFWFKQKKKYQALIKKSVAHDPRYMGELFLELVTYAIPFAILGLAANLFQLIDQVTFIRGMIAAGVDNDTSMAILGIYGGALIKILMIPVSFAIAFGQPLIPKLTHDLARGDNRGVRSSLMKAIQLTCFITVPAVVGLSMLATPIYTLLFPSQIEGMNAIGGEIFTVGASLGLFMALYSITTAILQGINEQKIGIISLGVALVVKFVGNQLLISHLEVNGAIISTMIAYTVCIGTNLVVIKKRTGFATRVLLRRLRPIMIFTVAMALAVFTVMSIQPFESALMQVVIGGVTGVGVYFGLAWYFGLLRGLLGRSTKL